MVHINKTRKKLGLSKEDFSFLINLSERQHCQLSSWERGEVEFPSSKIELIRKLPQKIPFKASGSKGGFKFIDLFAGIGGIRLPFQELGGECVFSSEWDKFAQRTYAVNFGEVPNGDITKIPTKDIPKHDLLLAGFPCQAFSQAGLKKGFNDTRGTLFFEIQRILSHHRPKAFLLENVKQFKGHDQGRTLETIMSVLTGKGGHDIPPDISLSKETREALENKLNYSVGFKVLSSKDFGVPQNRERIYIVGFDKNQVDDTLERDLPEEIFKTVLEGKKECGTLGDILLDSSSIPDKYTISDRLWSGHQRRKQEHKNKGNGFGYQIFDEKSPYCSTISARYYKDGSEILIDQSQLDKNPRKLTPREAARIQGFPDKFYIDFTSDNQTYKQFGNSVSVPVIRAIAQQIVKYM